MSFRPNCCRNIDDDHAPVDYNYVTSINEGRRRQQEQNIKKAEPVSPIMRHQTSPFERDAVDEYGTRARHMPATQRMADTVMKKLPSSQDGPAPARSIAYPEDFGIPENPFDPPAQSQQSVRPSRAPQGRSQPEIENWESQEQAKMIENADGSQFEAPTSPPMPEWLRVAQQNNMSVEERRARAPRVLAAAHHEIEAAAPPQTDMLGRPLRSRITVKPQPPAGALPQTAEEYELAGYPPELLKKQAEWEQQKVEQPNYRRHGAQYAVNQDKQQQYEQSTGAVPATRTQSYPPPRESRSRVSGERREQRDSQFEPETSMGRGAAYVTAAQGQTEYRCGRSTRYGAGQGLDETAQLSGNRAPVHQSDSYASMQNPYNPGDLYAVEAASYGAQSTQPAPARTPYGSQKDPCRQPNANNANALNASDWQDEESDQMPMYEERPPIPWLGIACFVTAMLAVGLWLMQLTFTSQTDQVIRARKENHDALKTNHPYRYQELIEEQAEKYNLDPAFVAAIVLNESSYNPRAESSVGARGLMQLMDSTASWIYEKMASGNGYNFDEMYEAQTNVEYGCWYLSFLKDRFRGDPVLVAAGFHAGQTEVQNWLNDSRYSADNLTIDLANMKDGPTKQYATRVVRDFSIYKRLYYETTEDNS